MLVNMLLAEDDANDDHANYVDNDGTTDGKGDNGDSNVKMVTMLTTVILKQKKSWKILKRHLKRYRKPHKKLKRRPQHSVVIPVKASIGLIKSKRCQRHKVQFREPGIVITKEPVGCVNNFRK